MTVNTLAEEGQRDRAELRAVRADVRTMQSQIRDIQTDVRGLQAENRRTLDYLRLAAGQRRRLDQKRGAAFLSVL